MMTKQVEELQYLPPFFWLLRWVRIQHGGAPDHEDLNLELNIRSKKDDIQKALKEAQALAGKKGYAPSVQTVILAPKHVLELPESQRSRILVYPRAEFVGLATTLPAGAVTLLIKLFIYIEGLEDGPNT